MNSPYHITNSDITELEILLKKFNCVPNKHLGQNYLVNQDVVSKIIRCIGETKDKHIMEIGPGIGVLTKELSQQNIKSLTVVEIDHRMKPFLNNIRVPNHMDYKIIFEDALKFNEEKYVSDKFIIVANLPYNVSTKLIIKWLKNLRCIEQILVMVQKEVADRLVAKKATSNYGRLSVLAQFTCECEVIFNLDPINFYPIPKVMSSVIKLTPKQNLPTPEEIEKVEKFCKIAFNYRRKKITKNIYTLGTNIDDTLDQLGIDKNKRAEQLSVDEFYRLSKILL